jgi:protein TonB
MKTKKKHLAILLLGFVLLTGYIPQVNAQEVYVTVEQMPQFPGGEKEMHQFIKDNFKYPATAEAKGIEGRITLRFTVGIDGTITNITIIRGIDPDCDAEAIRIIEEMPKWEPGKQGGKPVPVYYNLPISFRLPKQ